MSISLSLPPLVPSPIRARLPEFWSAASIQRVTGGKPADLPCQAAWGGRLPTTTQLSALLTKELPPSSPVVSPWLHSGESCLLWGGTGTGKSMIALTLALGAAGGGEAFGWNFPNPARVLLVDGEQSERDLQRRIPLLSQTVSGLDLTLASENLTIMARTAQEAGTQFFDMASPLQAEMLTEAVGRHGIGLVVFDNLSTLSDSVEDENSAAAFKPMQTLLTRLKKLNVAVILVHHAGKNPKVYRGSSSIATTFERVLGIVHNEAAPLTTLDVTITLEKFRDAMPAGFQPQFPAAFVMEKTEETGETRARWKVGQLSQLDEGWRMFAFGAHTSKAEFVAAYNARFTTVFNVGNFVRDFRLPWETKLGKTPLEIKDAERRVRERKDGGEGEAGGGF